MYSESEYTAITAAGDKAFYRAHLTAFWVSKLTKLTLPNSVKRGPDRR